MNALRLALLLVVIPAVAHASGSWAVPRFTPTWAELQRDLKALGFQTTAPQKRRPPVHRVAAKPPTVGTNTTGTGAVATDAAKQTTGTTGNATEGNNSTGTTSGTEPNKGTTEVTQPTVPAPPGACYCQPMPIPACADGSVPSGTVNPPAPQNVTPPPANPENTAPPADGKAAPAGKDSAKKGGKKGKTGRPHDDPNDTDKLKKKKYWWEDQQQPQQQ